MSRVGPRSHASSRGTKLGYYRASLACALCRKRKIRCLAAIDEKEKRCATCIRLNRECIVVTVDRMSHDSPRLTLSSKVITKNQDTREATQLQSSSEIQPPHGLSEISDSSASSSKSSKEGSTESSNTWKEAYSNHPNIQNEGGLSAIGTPPGLHVPYAAGFNWLPNNVSRPINATDQLFKYGHDGFEVGPGKMSGLGLEWQLRDDISNIVDVNLWNSWDAWAGSMESLNRQRFGDGSASHIDFTAEVQNNRSN
ncbi:hypothetical protein BP6252_10840 [Coleophoma cylindrospora]|uniref:Zn(2)-C6 fungal-type domain-containing protein n=1 Tax=Coleophoma cylindrospora TaxID=1849047 RepID=A0A3D8QNC0_9HELO|nr:hypothetical protein BP6252_10840 [Coleophoma cylindrospora]